MRFDRLFTDLEDQLASEWDAERAALESESDRLRMAKTTLRDRLIGLQAAHPVVVQTHDAAPVRGVIRAVGANFAALRPEADDRSRVVEALIVVPLSAIVWIGGAHPDLLRSARPDGEPRSPIADRMTFGFVLRDAARRRRQTRTMLRTGVALTGTIDRVGADHLDLALHDPGAPRRTTEVSGHRLVPFAGLAWVRLESVQEHDLP